MAFNAYKGFIKNALNNLMHPHITSFGDYINVVLSTLALLLCLLIIGAILFFLIRIPFIIYKKKISPIKVEICNTENHKKRVELEKKFTKCKILFALIITLIYVPILLPLILMLSDLIGLNNLIIIILILIGIIWAHYAINID